MKEEKIFLNMKEEEGAVAEGEGTQTTYKRGLDFWMVYVSNLVVDMLSVLDVVSPSLASPFPASRSPRSSPHLASRAPCPVPCSSRPAPRTHP